MGDEARLVVVTVVEERDQRVEAVVAGSRRVVVGSKRIVVDVEFAAADVEESCVAGGVEVVDEDHEPSGADGFVGADEAAGVVNILDHSVEDEVVGGGPWALDH